MSSGSIVGFVGIFTGLLIKDGWNIAVACILAVIMGALFGLVNGLFISYGKVPAFIATLGSMQVARGLPCLLSR